MESNTLQCVAALIKDIKYSANSKLQPVSKEPSGVLCSSCMKALARWFEKLESALPKERSEPTTAVQAASFVVRILWGKNLANAEVLLRSYHLPVPASLPAGVLFKLITLRVEPDDVRDGDGINVYVDNTDPWSKPISKTVLQAGRTTGLGKVFDPQKKKLQMCRIRPSGMDAPEFGMEHGKEAKAALVKLVAGNPLEVLVYGEDQYGRLIGDVYCKGICVQEEMLKGGHAWYYKDKRQGFPKRQHFATLQKEAKQKGVGLWASTNPEPPWEYKSRKRAGM